MLTKKVQKSNLYKYRRYWYHISTTLKDKEVKMIPWDSIDGFNRPNDEPPGKRICVSPSIEQCITAVPYGYSSTFHIYRTKNTVRAEEPEQVYDSHITDEGWLLEPTDFIKIGVLNFVVMETLMNVENVMEESASTGDLRHCRRVLKWWRKAKIKRFIDKT